MIPNVVLFSALNFAIALFVRVMYMSMFFSNLATIFSEDAIDLVICAIVIMLYFLLFWCICIACVILTHCKCSNYFHNNNKYFCTYFDNNQQIRITRWCGGVFSAKKIFIDIWCVAIKHLILCHKLHCLTL